jgi:hypothetical protein
MTNHWVLQANPKMYNIDGAIASLEAIAWRVPQYTGSISHGDGVVIWRSGPDAGFVGVGRVVGHPAEMGQGDGEAAFDHGDADSSVTTRLPIAVSTSSFMAKADIAALPGWSDHPIITAPMGTVFPISAGQWDALSPFLAELPAMTTMAPNLIPPVFAWDQRGKDTYPMPGGYRGYTATLRQIVTEVVERPPNREDLESWLRSTFDSSESNARLGSGFLLRVGILVERGETIEAGDFARNWWTSGDDGILVGLLHSRIRYIGEMLRAAIEPRTIGELLDVANRDFAAGWTTKAQVNRRRGWLQSAGMLTDLDGDRFQTTPAGLSLLDRLALQDPLPTSGGTATTITGPPPETLTAIQTLGDDRSTAPVSEEILGIERLISQLHATGTDGSKFEEFEHAARDAFERLGFNATWLGKSGRTDVLLEAELGKGSSYRVIVDCKSTGRGSVSSQIDWDTIDEHRVQHHADHALILAPDFGGGRVPDRAKAHETVLLKTEDLAELLRLHEKTPLSLDDYRLLFTGNDLDNPTAPVAEVGEVARRRLDLTAAVTELLSDRGSRMGPMSARDFFGALMDRDDLPDASDDEIDEVLSALSSPLVGLLHRDAGGAVRFATSRQTAAHALRRLAQTIE